MNHKTLFYTTTPLLVFAFPFVWYSIVADNRALVGELGVIEHATVIFLLIAIYFFISSLVLVKSKRVPQFLSSWLIVLILGAIYFAGEELSWGQHIIGWHSPEVFQQINDQGETNLHNISAVFDQLPRLLVTLSIAIGGVILPIYRITKKIYLNKSHLWYWVLPTSSLLTISILVIIARPALEFLEHTFVDIFSVGEFKECLIALFIMLYSVSLKQRLQTY